MRFMLPTLMLMASLSLSAAPAEKMNKAFASLSELLPFIAGDKSFHEKKYEKTIQQNLDELTKTFSNMKHEGMLKNEIFAPSYEVIRDHLTDTQKAFKKGQKGYAQWRLKELTSLCLDCHSRMPEDHTSQYQEGRLQIPKKQFQNLYNLGIAQLIVRQYPDAKETFTGVIEKELSIKEFKDTEKSFKQLLLIRAKILSEYEAMLEAVSHYQKKKELPGEIRSQLAAWKKRLFVVQKKDILKSPLRKDKDAQKLISEVLRPIKDKEAALVDNFDVDLLAASGQLSRYLFHYPESKLIPEISYWLGWSEKILRREQFFSSGELFLKQCIRHYPSNPMAKKCYEELKETLEFEFTGSSGTHLPDDVKQELESLKEMMEPKDKKNRKK